MVPGARCSIGTANHFQTRSIDRNRKRDRIVAVGLRHVPGGEDDHLISVGQHRSMDFRAAYHQTVRAFLHDAYVIIWMRLLRWSHAAVAFYVSLGYRHR